MPITGTGQRTFPKIPVAFWPQIARERAAGTPARALAAEWHVSESALRAVLKRYEEQAVQL